MENKATPDSDLGNEEQNSSSQGRVAARPAHPVPFQDRVRPWLLECFGEQVAGDKIERNHRFLEESLELVQACGCTQSEAHQLVDYTFGRLTGEAPQEVGGVMVTLAALCLAQGLDMHSEGEVELARIWTKVDVIRAKQAAKPAHSPLPESSSGVAAAPTFDEDYVNAVRRGGRSEGFEEAISIAQQDSVLSWVGGSTGSAKDTANNIARAIKAHAERSGLCVAVPDKSSLPASSVSSPDDVTNYEVAATETDGEVEADSEIKAGRIGRLVSFDQIRADLDKITTWPWRWGDWDTAFGEREPIAFEQRNTLEHSPQLFQTCAGVRRRDDRGCERVLRVEDGDIALADRYFIMLAPEYVAFLLKNYDTLRTENERLSARCEELERRLRIPFGSLPCAGCGGPYRFDTTLPSVIWNHVIRAHGLPEYLCTTCIVREFAKAGESFTATLWGDEFNGVPIEVLVNGQGAVDATALSEENTGYRVQIADLTARCEAVEAQKADQGKDAQDS